MMTDSHSARDEAEHIAADTYRPRPRCRDCADYAGTCPNDNIKCDPKEQLADRIEAAILAYGRRERAQGMRDAAVMCADLGSERERNCIPETADQASSEAAMLRLCARRVEHRARETEGTKA